MGWWRRRSLPEAWLLLFVGLSILLAVVGDVGYFGTRHRSDGANPAYSDYPLPQVTGALRLQHQRYLAAFPVGGPCKGLGPYDDLLGGTPVVVENEAGAVIATGALDIGKVADRATCEFALAVQSLPKADVYQFAVDQRIVGTYRYDDLVARGWQVTLSLN